MKLYIPIAVARSCTNSSVNKVVWVGIESPMLKPYKDVTIMMNGILMLYVKENKVTHIILKKLVMNKACFVVKRFAKV